MGQYQQWLFYQEVDQRLRAQIEALEIKLAQLQDHARHLEQTCPHLPKRDNVIIRALASDMERAASPLKVSPSGGVEVPLTETSEFMRGISPSLLDWGELPDFHSGPQAMREPFYDGDKAAPLATPYPASQHAEMVLVPEDVVAVFEEYGRTEPQLELPWWLHNIIVSSGTLDQASPIDQESIRTNRLVQRWLERWGRRSSVPEETMQEDREDTPHE